jgi:uncharacterized protein (TIRG00374 family)
MKKIILFIFGLILLVFVITFKLDLSTLGSLIGQKISGPFYLMISLLIISQLLFRSLRFMFLYNNSAFDSRIHFLASCLLSSASFFVALATPNKTGDMLRGLLHKKRMLEITAVTTVEYLLDIGVFFLIPVLGLLLVCSSYSLEIIAGYTVLAVLLLSLFCLFKFLRQKKIFTHWKWYINNKDKIQLGLHYYKESLKNKFSLSLGFLFTCFFHGTYHVIFYMVLHKLGAKTTILETIFSAGVGFLIGSLTFIPMGMGSRDASAYGVLVSLGTNPEIAMSSVIIMRSLSLSLALASGLCYFITVYTGAGLKGVTSKLDWDDNTNR